MVRAVKTCKNVSDSSRLGKISVSSFFSTFLGSGKFVEIRELSENSEIVVPETLFSEANI